MLPSTLAATVSAAKQLPSRVLASFDPLPPGSCLVSNLPFDVLKLLLSYLSPHARLGGASLVCRRWRAAVVRGITQLSGFSNGSLTFLPSLSDLMISHSLDYASIPTSLQALTLRYWDLGRDCYHRHLTHLRSLTSLDIECDGRCYCWTKLCTANSAALETLKLRLVSARYEFHLPSATSFPSLRTLSVTTSGIPHDQITRLMEKSPQLTLVSLHARAYSADFFTSFHLAPTVTHVSITLPLSNHYLMPQVSFLPSDADDDVENEVNVEPRLPPIATLWSADGASLQRLEVQAEKGTTFSVEIIDRASAILTSFNMNAETLAPSVLQDLQRTLIRCTRLTSLALRLPAQTSFLLFISSPFSVESLNVVIRSETDFADLSQFTSLRSLTLELEPLTLPTSTFVLQKLRHLEIFFPTHSLPRCLAILSQFLHFCPLLVQFTVLGCPLTSRTDLREVIAFLSEAERIGVEQVKWSGDASTILELRTRFKWLRVMR